MSASTTTSEGGCGIDAYTLIEHYLRLAKGVTEQGNVYVRSRQRRDTHDKDGDE